MVLHTTNSENFYYLVRYFILSGQNTAVTNCLDLDYRTTNLAIKL